MLLYSSIYRMTTGAAVHYNSGGQFSSVPNDLILLVAYCNATKYILCSVAPVAGAGRRRCLNITCASYATVYCCCCIIYMRISHCQNRIIQHMYSVYGIYHWDVHGMDGVGCCFSLGTPVAGAAQNRTCVPTCTYVLVCCKFRCLSIAFRISKYTTAAYIYSKYLVQCRYLSPPPPSKSVFWFFFFLGEFCQCCTHSSTSLFMLLPVQVPGSVPEQQQ